MEITQSCGFCGNPHRRVISDLVYCTKKCKWDAANRRRKQVEFTLRWITDVIKSQPCEDCHESFPPHCMDFDHRDPETKTDDVSTLCKGTGVDACIALIRELQKCDLVCANCHRDREHLRRN